MPNIRELSDEVGKVIQGFGTESTMLQNAIEAIENSRVLPDHKKAVLAQCQVVLELYSGVLYLVADKQALSAFALSRNLFEVVISTIYLAKHEELLYDFIDYGVKTHYELIRDTDSKILMATHPALAEELELLKNDYDDSVLKFGRDRWHRLQVKDLVKDAGFEPLYRLYYKMASSIPHGDGFILLHRMHFKTWTLKAKREKWESYNELSARFSFLVVASFLGEINRALRLGQDHEIQELEGYIANHPEYSIPVYLR